MMSSSTARLNGIPEAARVASATRDKQRQIVFKMMREADLLSGAQRILPALLSARLVDAIRATILRTLPYFRSRNWM
jgi:hypothetical protein